MTPDHFTKFEDKEAELNRELTKQVIFPSNFVDEYSKAIKAGEMEVRINLGIQNIMTEKEKAAEKEAKSEHQGGEQRQSVD